MQEDREPVRRPLKTSPAFYKGIKQLILSSCQIILYSESSCLGLCYYIVIAGLWGSFSGCFLAGRKTSKLNVRHHWKIIKIKHFSNFHESVKKMVPFRKRNQLTDNVWRMQPFLKARKHLQSNSLLFVLPLDLETFLKHSTQTLPTHFITGAQQCLNF